MNQICWTRKIRLITLTLFFLTGIIVIIGCGGEGDDDSDVGNADALWIQGSPPYENLTVHFIECNFSERENTQYGFVHDEDGRLIEWEWRIKLNSGNCEGQTVNLIIHPVNGTYTHLDVTHEIQL